MTDHSNNSVSQTPNQTHARHDDNEIIAQMRQLIDTIRLHNHAYYVLDEPQISDNEYDQLRLSLIELEEAYPDLIQPDSPTG